MRNEGDGQRIVEVHCEIRNVVRDETTIAGLPRTVMSTKSLPQAKAGLGIHVFSA